MSGVKRDLVIHYDEVSQKIVFYTTDISNTEAIRAEEFDGVSPEVDFFRSLPPDEAEQKLGGMVFALLDLHSSKKVGIRNYAVEAEAAQAQWIQELEEEAKRNDPEAQYQLFIHFHSSATKNCSLSELARAESLLFSSAGQGFTDAILSLENWPEIKASAERLIQRGKKA